ncbi:MAG: hypothetical protein GX595_07515, partial [Lentisphaerae bacterium]|nr:hypothetical protein [Lentisphaerota bacterium]
MARRDRSVSMAARSSATTVLLTILTLVAALGFYLLITATDVMRSRTESTVREVQALRSEIERLRLLVEGGALSGALPGGRGQALRSALANADLRDPAAVDGGGISIRVGSEAANLNAVINNDAMASSYWEMAYDALAARNMKNPSRWEPLLAERWEISPDRLTYTIHLRRGVTWHDVTDPSTGRVFTRVPVTAHDFAFYVDVIRNPGIHCEPVRNYFSDLDRIEV